jgi:hypothetical protein
VLIQRLKRAIRGCERRRRKDETLKRRQIVKYDSYNIAL